MTSPEKLVSNLTNTYSKTQLIYEMNCGEFYRLTHPMVAKKSNEDWFIFKQKQISPELSKLEADKDPIDLFYGKIYTIKQNSENVGFLVNTPVMSHTIQKDYLLSYPKTTKLQDLDDTSEVYLTSSVFSVLVLDKTVQYVSAYDRNIISKFT